MLSRLLALLVFVVVSPVGDAINGYLKAPEGSCSALGVLSPHRMAFLCGNGQLMVAQITRMDLPDPYHPACLNEALRGIQALAALKWSLYIADDIRTYSTHWEGDLLYAGVLIDLESVESAYLDHMSILNHARPTGDWCSS